MKPDPVHFPFILKGVKIRDDKAVQLRRPTTGVSDVWIAPNAGRSYKIPIVPPEIADLFDTGFAGSLDHIIVPDRCKTPSGAPGSANRGGHCGQSSSRQCSHEFGLLAARSDIRAERTAAGESQLVNGRLCDPALCFITLLISVASGSC
jgi:hypothetical protein